MGGLEGWRERERTGGWDTVKGLERVLGGQEEGFWERLARFFFSFFAFKWMRIRLGERYTAFSPP